MNKLRNQKGRISLLELLIIGLILIEALFLLGKSFGWFADQATGGDDRFLVNTAESVARVNSLNGVSCPVDGCNGGDKCVHRQGDDYVGYFNDITHKIDGSPKDGYNQNRKMRVGKEYYYGDPGTMVIEIRCNDGNILISWVEGK